MFCTFYIKNSVQKEYIKNTLGAMTGSEVSQLTVNALNIKKQSNVAGFILFLSCSLRIKKEKK